MKLIESFLTKNPCYTCGRTIVPKGLMLHSVGCPQPSASVFVKNWNRVDYDRACVHGFIDANTGDVYQTLPWNRRGWHCGAAANNTHIGVEMCEPACIKYTGGATFTCSNLAVAKACAERTYKSAVELFAMLCKQYNFDPMKDGVILSHKEGCARGIASNHGDPEHLWTQLGMGYTMNTFRAAVKAAMNGVSVPTTPSNPTTPVKPATPGVVTATEAAKSKLASLAGTYQVTAKDGLHIRNGAGVSKNSLTVLPFGTKVRNYGYYTSVGNVKWLYIQVTYNGVKYTGFSSAEWLKKV